MVRALNTNSIDAAFEERTYRKVSRRILPFLFLCYIFAYIDRVNVSFAKLQMQGDLGISEAVYGTAAGIFFIGYFFFEIPCNVAMQKIGARYWLGPIMIVWGTVSACTMLVKSGTGFYAVRFLLGIVESGFFPGVILYLTFWYPSRYRARMVATFMTAIPLSGVIGGPISGRILEKMSHAGGLRGWQWLYLLEALPSILAGLATFYFLPNGPRDAKWLSAEERELVASRLEEEDRRKRASAEAKHSLGDAFRSGKVWALCFVYFGFTMGNYGLTFFLPQMIKDTLTANPFYIGLLTMIPWGAAAVSMVLVGRHSDQTGERCWHVAIAGMIGALAFAASALPGLAGIPAFVALTIACAGIAAAYTTFWALPSAFVTGTAASAAIAWINSVGNLGGYFGPSLTGKIRELTQSSTLALFTLSAGCLMSVALTIIFFRKQSEQGLRADVASSSR
ncbi:MAG TPA: MFS transporter [Bryobacteraceae bacterium]|jgi:MFS family permease|nr:MFS transporter [Bryobacteraceae bacterium]